MSIIRETNFIESNDEKFEEFFSFTFFENRKISQGYTGGVFLEYCEVLSGNPLDITMTINGEAYPLSNFKTTTFGNETRFLLLNETPPLLNHQHNRISVSSSNQYPVNIKLTYFILKKDHSAYFI